MTVKPWIKAADDAGPLPEGAADFLSCMLVPDASGKLITLPAETWQGMWRLAHMARVLDQPNAVAVETDWVPLAKALWKVDGNPTQEWFDFQGKAQRILAAIANPQP